jgi:general secretion pathway protein G
MVNALPSRRFSALERVIVTLTVAAFAPMLAVNVACAAAVPLHLHHVRAAKEAVLEEDRYTLQKAVEAYTIDGGKRPASLNDLVEAGYLKSIPKNPMAPKKGWNSW